MQNGTPDMPHRDYTFAGAEVSPVRPYALTQGRTSVGGQTLPIEALVSTSVRDVPVGATPERRQILQLAAQNYVSVAEIAAHVSLPLGVVRVLVADLVAEKLASVHGVDLSPSAPVQLETLQTLLTGISHL